MNPRAVRLLIRSLITFYTKLLIKASYGLVAALRLTSKYAKCIYPPCSQWKDLGKTKKYDLQEFRTMLGLTDDKGDGKLTAFKDFRLNVLDLAVKQINEHTELHVGYKLEKVIRASSSKSSRKP